jgi:hypothetical protein
VEEEEVLEDQLAAEGLRGRVTIANQLSDRQVKSLIPVIVQIRVAQLYIELSRKGKSDSSNNAGWDFAATG